MVVFLWMVNRQFHFKRHSYEKKPLRPLKKVKSNLRKARKSITGKLGKKGIIGNNEQEEVLSVEEEEHY